MVSELAACMVTAVLKEAQLPVQDPLTDLEGLLGPDEL